eukprot:CAMPEP_0179493442 /NCGR_PEP_ID=MMETSP0799-20121207/67453_1 /TAXON_ID=46947 /ORGANISM="Geminigera cryophila, Strain CCMP2564" /LENGTH=61 /DNA_ID=CAMNT_0021310619 /DNA_START=38 /DNA_END=226 /DNA_ORIENTATION=-
MYYAPNGKGLPKAFDLFQTYLKFDLIIRKHQKFHLSNICLDIRIPWSFPGSKRASEDKRCL